MGKAECVSKVTEIEKSFSISPTNSKRFDNSVIIMNRLIWIASPINESPFERFGPLLPFCPVTMISKFHDRLKRECVRLLKAKHLIAEY